MENLALTDLVKPRHGGLYFVKKNKLQPQAVCVMQISKKKNFKKEMEARMRFEGRADREMSTPGPLCFYALVQRLLMYGLLLGNELSPLCCNNYFEGLRTVQDSPLRGACSSRAVVMRGSPPGFTQHGSFV